MIRGTIMLLSSDGSELFVDVARDVPHEEREDLRYRRGEGIVGGVVQTGQAAIIPANLPGTALHQPHPQTPQGG